MAELEAFAADGQLAWRCALASDAGPFVEVDSRVVAAVRAARGLVVIADRRGNLVRASREADGAPIDAIVLTCDESAPYRHRPVFGERAARIVAERQATTIRLRGLEAKRRAEEKREREDAEWLARELAAREANQSK